MTQAVPSEIPDTRLANRRFKPVLVPMQWLSHHSNKHRPRSVWRTLLQRLERSDRQRVQRYMPGRPVLALWDRDDLARQVHTVPGEPILFGGPDSGVQGDVKLRQVLGIVLGD